MVERISCSSKFSKDIKLFMHVSSMCICYTCDHSVLCRVEIPLLPESCKDGADISLDCFHGDRIARAWSLQSDRALVGCFKNVQFVKIFSKRPSTVDLASIDRHNSPLAGVERPREMNGEELSERRVDQCKFTAKCICTTSKHYSINSSALWRALA